MCHRKPSTGNRGGGGQARKSVYVPGIEPASFDDLDAFFHRLTIDEVTLAKADRIEFHTGDELEQARTAELIIEGRRRELTRNAPERNTRARLRALERGYRCQVCGFSFEETYGVKFAEVHHLALLSGGEKRIDPEKDLLVVCSNCHSMLHPAPGKTTDWRALRNAVLARRRRSHGA